MFHYYMQVKVKNLQLCKFSKMVWYMVSVKRINICRQFTLNIIIGIIGFKSCILLVIFCHTCSFSFFNSFSAFFWANWIVFMIPFYLHYWLIIVEFFFFTGCSRGKYTFLTYHNLPSNLCHCMYDKNFVVEFFQFLPSCPLC